MKSYNENVKLILGVGNPVIDIIAKTNEQTLNK